MFFYPLRQSRYRQLAPTAETVTATWQYRRNIYRQVFVYRLRQSHYRRKTHYRPPQKQLLLYRQMVYRRKHFRKKKRC